MSSRLSILLTFLCLGFSSQAFALFEARLTYGGLASSPNLSQLYSGTATVPSVVPNVGLGGDILLFIPLTGFGAGVRYEGLGFNASGNGLTYKSQATRTSAVVTYRFVNTVLNFGPIFTYGVTHTNSMSVTDSTTGQSYNWSPDNSTSYQLGLDLGVGIFGLLAGGEIGYENMKWNKMKDSTGTSTNTPDTDMSGTFMKVYLGFGF